MAEEEASRLTVAVLAAFDTKAAECGYLCAELQARGCRVVLVDVGLRGSGPAPACGADEVHGRDHVAAAADTSTEAIGRCETSDAIAAVGRGAGTLLTALVANAGVRAVVAIGGAKGTAVAGLAIRDLDESLPKIILSASTAQHAADALKGSDAVLMLTGVDLSGLNTITREYLPRAARIVLAAAEVVPGSKKKSSLVLAITSLGVTSEAVAAIQRRLVDRVETVVFPALISGLKLLRRAVAHGQVLGIVHLTPQDLVLAVVNGEADFDDWPDVPTVVVPGSLDMRIESEEKVGCAAVEGRATYRHAPGIVLVRTTESETRAMGERLGALVSRLSSPCSLVFPGGGFSTHDSAGGPFEDRVADRAFLEGVRASADGRLRIVETNLHLSTEEFADIVIGEVERIIIGSREESAPQFAQTTAARA